MDCQNNFEYTDKNMEIQADLTIPSTDIFHGMFRCCGPLKDITTLSTLGVSKVNDMAEMFRRCKQLNHL